jgi:uncharacterized membrane protein
MMTESAGDTRADPKTWAIIIWGAYIASFIGYSVTAFAFTPFAGVVVAYLKRRDLIGTPFESHVTSAIWTFWIDLTASIVLALVSWLVFGGMYNIIGVPLVIWEIFRTFRGLIFALDRREIKDPTGWL